MRLRLVASILAATLPVVAMAGPLHMRFTRSKCGVPCRYDYQRLEFGLLPRRTTATVTSELAIPVKGSRPNGRLRTRTTVNTYTKATGVRIRSRELIERATAVDVAEKRFVCDDVVAGPVTLSDCGAILDEEGSFRLTGLLLHSGGDAGAIRRGHVTVRVRGLAGPGESVAVARVPGVWSASESVWVERQVPHPFTLQLRGVARAHFQGTTRIQVDVVYRHDR